ncbi:unnamed protein product [Symbiodinium natans]|uniref:Uncharacterized protein n=1 Tax=Symbiodinium natans TaxID=878477 RepID=A0A812TWY1_9DINO|nr:unnamed protein product [Symbiodinium natans]
MAALLSADPTRCSAPPIVCDNATAQKCGSKAASDEHCVAISEICFFASV